MSFCQNDSPVGGSFWQKDSLITHILFELWLITLLWIVSVFWLRRYEYQAKKEKKNNYLFIYVIEKNRKDRVQYFYSRYLVKINVVMTKRAFTCDVRWSFWHFRPTYLPTLHTGSNFFLIVVARAISNSSKNHSFLICRI